MAAKAFFILCAQAFLMQSVCSQCIEHIGAGHCVGPLSAPLAYDGCSGVASTGGDFAVTSTSPFAPTGVSVVSENAIEGPLVVDGNLPLLGSVDLEGACSTAGAGAISYGCGNGEVGIASESPFSSSILSPGAVGHAPILGARSPFLSTRTGPAFTPFMAGAAIAPSFLGARGGFAPGLARGCGCGARY